MTAMHFDKGTLVTCRGIPGFIDNRSVDPPGYWIRPINGPSVPFAISDLEIESSYNDSFRVGAEKDDLPDDLVALSTVDPSKVSDVDMATQAYRLRIIEAIDDRIRRNPKALRRKRLLFGEIAASVEPPEGVEPILGASAERLYNVFKRSGCNPASLFPRTGYRGNRDSRKPDFVLEAIEQAIDNKYTGWGTLPAVQTEAIRIAKLNLPTDLSEYTYQVGLSDGTAEQRSMIDRNGDGLIDWMTLVSYAIVRRALKKRHAVDRIMRIYGAEEGRRLLRVVGPGPGIGRPLETGETDDSWLSGLFVVDDENWFPLGYPCFTAIIELATRAILGWDVHFMPQNSDGVGRVLKHAIMPKDLSWMGAHPDGIPVVAGRYPMFGKLNELRCDQGGDFISKHTRDAAFRCGTSLTVLPPKSPELKPFIERFFGTVKRGEFAAALGILPKKLREALAKSRKGRKDPVVVTLRELKLLLGFWIVEVYHHTVHRGHGMTPYEAWEKLTAEMKVKPPPAPADLALLTGKYEPSRVINANGFRIHGLEYNSKALGALRERYADENGILRDVEIKYDAQDVSKAWALGQDPHNPKRTVAVPAECKQMRYAKGLSEYQHIVIKAHARAKAGKRILTVEQLIQARLELEQMARKMIAERNAGGSSIKLARYLNANRAYLNDPAEIDEATASANYLSLVDEEPIKASDELPARRGKTVAATSHDTPAEPPEVEPMGTEVLRAEANAGRRKLGLIADD
ncbi:Mu transposase C-terminal domain-containing protein [Mesorhizobium sp. VK25A]|uniref:Mu transposase C-terminal domain-containing protein n=1 Tax=Mesorhizobium vachelliae TaxID=3072309 RepID=A0ABU4ZWL6_9HYPH|nr:MULTISPECIES: Mu transposase C-terminal domain-containing protein [unclassified Mesorhizobium]MDX8529775.1 Mu transposase C-terminal domain-containing protein [Mesorhizobium sp. VK25D]MDX8544173.1 Mu transposase C-terminal domain-containing protein [Mesorhizobium sp. VK25A]